MFSGCNDFDRWHIFKLTLCKTSLEYLQHVNKQGFICNVNRNALAKVRVEKG